MIDSVLRLPFSCVALALLLLAPGSAFGEDYCRIEGIEWIAAKGEGSGLGGTGHSGEGSGLGGTGHSGEGSGLGGTGHSGEGSGLGGTGYAKEGVGIGGTGLVGDETGMGGTGVFGTITRFGSVCVNGLRVSFDDEVAVRLNDAVLRGSEALELGQVVWLVATPEAGRLVTSEIEVLGYAENGIDFEGVADWVVERIERDPGIEGLSIEGSLERGPQGRLWIQGLPLDVSGLPEHARELPEGRSPHVWLMGPLGPDGELRVRGRSTPLPRHAPYPAAPPLRMRAPGEAAPGDPPAVLAPRPSNEFHALPAFATWNVLGIDPLDTRALGAPRQAPALSPRVDLLKRPQRLDRPDRPARLDRPVRPARPPRPDRLERPPRPPRLLRP
ncbi:MAG: hypothetical protein JRG96_13030 [Deltaproteobacteria bacterium]|nr:hypothetical protein [Deltaproteobacteria bacterium]MBW2420211.1 hypothetical protein [Deltaproteobacteria bacterium]